MKCARCGSTYTLSSRYTSKRTGEGKAYYQCCGYNKNRSCDQKTVVTGKEIELQLIPWLTRESERLASLGEHKQQITESFELINLRQQLSTLESIANGNPSIEKAASELRAQIEVELVKCNSQDGYTYTKREFMEMFSDSTFWECLT
ncbi:MAG: hypothetical protein HC908_08770 [Calothrix sp. SM1_7_51]|nr:hypothetical protein [Calothrix sp. SM1_7_51]